MATEAEILTWIADSRKVRVNLSPGVAMDGFITELIPAKALVQLDSGSVMSATLPSVIALTDEQVNSEVEQDILTALGGGAEARAVLSKLRAANIDFSKREIGISSGKAQ